MKKYCFLIGWICIVFLGIGFFAEAAEVQKEKVEIQLSWKLLSADYAAYLLGERKGFYAEQNLDVKFISGLGSANTIQLVAGGERSFGFTSITNAMVAREKGYPIKVVAAIFNSTPSCIVFDGNLGIKSLKDLEGKKVASRVANAQFLGFKTMLKINNVDFEKIRLISLTSGSSLKLFIVGEADATINYAFDAIPTLNYKYPEKKIGYFMFKDFGMNILTQGIVTRDEIFEENPGLVQRVVTASLKSIEYAISHPEEALEILLERKPKSNKDMGLAMIKGVLGLSVNRISKNHGIGYIDPQKWQETMNLLVEAKMLSSDFDHEKGYTNEFLR